MITGYQVISADEKGYSALNTVIVYKEVVERLLKIFSGLKVRISGVFLSSYGLCNLYNYIRRLDNSRVMIIDIDASQAELAIVSGSKVLFSRAFKIDTGSPGGPALFINEINKSKDAYLKEMGGVVFEKIFLTGTSKGISGFSDVLKSGLGVPVELLPYDEIKFSPHVQDYVSGADYSFTNLLGFCLKTTQESLSLLPEEEKAALMSHAKRGERIRLGVVGLAVILVFSLALAKSMDNKSKYIVRLEKEISSLSKEARPLEDIERKIKMAGTSMQQKPSGLDILYEISRVLPGDILLTALNFEEGKSVILRGQAQGLNPVFLLLGELQNSESLKKFNIKVKYATKRLSAAGETVDFEIDCERAQ